MRCAIVPPHMLERVARSADDPALREIARRSLIIDAVRRIERRIGSAEPPAEVEDFTPKRTINDAKNKEELPGLDRSRGGWSSAVVGAR